MLRLLYFAWFVIEQAIGKDVQPYANGGHSDIYRNHQYVRECQPIVHGVVTHEFMKPKYKEISIETKYIKFKVKGNNQYGHRTVVTNPLASISVLEPFRAGGCKNRTLAFVQESALQQNCLVAVNAGFFQPEKHKKDYGKCYGNIISNGKLVQDSQGVQNAQFGIKQDGTVMIGYLTEDEVANSTFYQLISGVGWILRNGESYLNESRRAECRETETTGTLDEFFHVQSARTMVGYDGEGKVHIVQFDGKTHDSGISLYDAVDYLKSIGLTNAINFDGGGSATFVHGSTIINYPSNTCEGNENELCPRNVSTIICVKGNSIYKTGTITSMKECCNRNYVLVVFLSSLIGCCLLCIVCLCNTCLVYRSLVHRLTSSEPQKEALQSLLGSHVHSSDADSEDEDEL